MSFDPDIWYSLCPVCFGADTLLLPGGLTFGTCPACLEGLVPHEC